MPEIEIIASLLETLGIVGLCLVWLKDKNDTIRHERENREGLSKEILEDWKEMRSNRSHIE